MANDNRTLIVDESLLRNKIYVVRGQQVMLDFDLAEIYGYTTKAFNQQVKNNIEKFDDDFRFQLTWNEVESLSRSNILTLNKASRGGNVKYLPWCFTESGVYMLMTVLKGDLATQQSKALIRTFKQMKDYVYRMPLLQKMSEIECLSMRITDNATAISEIKQSMVTKADLSDMMKLFDQDISREEVLILDGEPFKADEAYQKIYKNAVSKIMVIDDYIGTKTLHHLAHAKRNAKITIISDNCAKPRLSMAEYNDFQTENPGRSIVFIQSQRKSHDRYIILDEGTKQMKIYHCGASSKDAGRRITTITRLNDVEEYKKVIKTMLKNPELVLN